jgi:hypothetical protein
MPPFLFFVTYQLAESRGIGCVLFVAAGWIGLTAVTAAPLTNFVGINGAACAYPTISDAIAAAVDGDAIYLAPNLYNETLGTLDNDLHFTAATADCTAVVPNAAPFDYTIDGGGAAAFEGGMAYIAPGQTITFTNMYLQNTQAVRGGVIYVAEGATAVVQRSRVRNGTATDRGGLIYVAPDASLTLVNLTFVEGGSAGNAGGGIYLEGYAHLFSGVRVQGNSAPSGGGVAIAGDGHLALRQSQVGEGVAPNTADIGGGVHMTGQARLELIQGSSIRWNDALVGHGGGIFADGPVTIDLYGSSRVYGNDAAVWGGGIYAANGASVTLHDLSQIGDSNPINGNGAARGGGIYATAAQQVTLAAGTAVQHNHASNEGGGILLADNTPLTMAGGLIHANVAGVWGGGVAVVQGRAHLTNVQISANQAQAEGGGIYQANHINNQTVITNSQIISNTAGSSGGGIWTMDAPVLLRDTDGSTRLASNHADLHGGGAYVTQSGVLLLMADTAVSHLRIENNTAGASGGGLYSNNQANMSIAGRVWLQDNDALGSGGGLGMVDGELMVTGLGDLRPHIVGNEALNGDGGGLYLSNVGAGGISGLRNVTISGNVADNQGGGLYVTNNSVLYLENGLIHDNQSLEGGGMLISNAAVQMRPHLESCANAQLAANHYCSELRGNSAGPFNGGGVRLQLGAALTLEQTAVISNSAQLGSGVYSASNGDHLEITNSLFSHNTGKALFIANDAFLDLVHNTFADNVWAIDINDVGAIVSQNNNIIWGNGFGVESAVGLPPGCSISQNGVLGTIADPLFQTTRRGDYRLGSGSPAIDACAMGATLDLDGVPRPQGANYDMGAFEGGRPLFLFPATFTAPEGDAGLTAVSFPIFLSETSDESVSVLVTAVAGTALENVDFAPLAETIIFPAGSISQTVMLPIIGDVLHEGDETFTLHLSNAQGGALTAVPTTITIADDDPLPTLTVADSSVVEGNAGTTPLTFTFSLSHPSAFPVMVDYSTGNDGDTAVGNADYQSSSGTVTIPAGQTTAPLIIRIYGDEIEEEDEQFALRLFNPQGTILSASQATGTILDDDGLRLIFLPIVVR